MLCVAAMENLFQQPTSREADCLVVGFQARAMQEQDDQVLERKMEETVTVDEVVVEEKKPDDDVVGSNSERDNRIQHDQDQDEDSVESEAAENVGAEVVVVVVSTSTSVPADPFANGPRPALVKSQSAPATPLIDEDGKVCGFSRNSGARRVSFPADDLLVTGYVEPPNPWDKVAVDMTAMEIVAAYVAACERYSVAPIDCVIHQMQKVGSFSKRLDHMDLQGEVLDFGQIEALEEIFKRVQFVTIDLANTSLDDEGSTALFDMIEYYESAESLNISRNNNISMRGWQSCCRMIKRMHCLWELNASGIKLGDNVHILQRMLRSGTNLTTLHLENCNISGKHFAILMTALKMNTSLKKLYLGENKLCSTDAVQVANFLRANCRLKLLNLGNNQLEDKGLIHIAEGLGDQASTTYRTGLAALVLHNNRLTQKSTPHLAKVLKECHHLETLDVGDNDISNDGVHCLKDALIRNRTLHELGLKNCQITCEGAIALAEYIADNPCIQSVDLRDNTIKLGGLMALTQSMEVNHSVTSLHLDGPPDQSTQPLKDLDQLHHRLLSEITTYCERNTGLTEQRLEREAQERQDQPPEVLSEPVSRLLSLWANAPPPRRTSAPPTTLSTAPPPPITVSPVVESPTGENGCGGWQTIRGVSSTPHYLRSPQPSPSCSPIPSPTRNRFRVTRVFQEADCASSPPSGGGSSTSSSPSPPPPVITPISASPTPPGRFGRFKFTPVKTINGVDASLPPTMIVNDGISLNGSTPNGGGVDIPLKRDNFVAELKPRERRTGVVTPPHQHHRITSPGTPNSEDDSVFLDTPSGPLNSRVRHNSMLYYQKKLAARENERRSSLPFVESGAAHTVATDSSDDDVAVAVGSPQLGARNLDRVSVSSSSDDCGQAVVSDVSRVVGGGEDCSSVRTVPRRNGFKSFRVQRVSLPEEDSAHVWAEDSVAVVTSDIVTAAVIVASEVTSMNMETVNTDEHFDSGLAGISRFDVSLVNELNECRADNLVDNLDADNLVDSLCADSLVDKFGAGNLEDDLCVNNLEDKLCTGQFGADKSDDSCANILDEDARVGEGSTTTTPLDSGGDRDSGIYLLDSSVDDVEVPSCDPLSQRDPISVEEQINVEEPINVQLISDEEGRSNDETNDTVCQLTEETSQELISRFLSDARNVQIDQDVDPSRDNDDDICDDAGHVVAVETIVDRALVDIDRWTAEKLEENDEVVVATAAMDEADFEAGDEPESDCDVDGEQELVSHICFSLVDVDDYERRFEDDADPWTIESLTITRGRSPSMLDLLTGDEDDVGSVHSSEQHRTESPALSLCNGDLMSFFDKDGYGDQSHSGDNSSPSQSQPPLTLEALTLSVHATTSGSTKRVCFVDGEVPPSEERGSDLVSVWMLEQQQQEQQDGGATSDWSSSTMSCSTSASSSKSLQEALLQRGGSSGGCSGSEDDVLEGGSSASGSSESSNSSDSGVPESPVSCSPPPVEDASGTVVVAVRDQEDGGDDGFPDRKQSFQRSGGRLSVSTVKGISLGLDILERLDLKSSVPLSPGQLAQSKGMIDMATEYLIQREESPSSMEMRRENNKLACPVVDKLLVMPFNSAEEATTT